MDFLTNINLGKNELQNARIQNLATAPQGPVEGMIYFNTTDKTAYVFANGAWQNALYTYKGEEFTTVLKNKLNGISSGANKVEKSTTNGNIKVDGTETTVYTHPGTGTNPHGTTKADVDLGNVENKSAATILNELTKAKLVEKLGFTPTKIVIGTDAAKGSATGSKSLYIATDTKKIWLDNAAGAWVQVGGQDTIAWSNITGKPAAFTPPIASKTVLGGIKVGENLEITSDGTLSAITTSGDGKSVYVINQETFIAAEGQTKFTLTVGKYRTGAGLLSIFLNGVKVRKEAISETGNTTFELATGIQEGDQVLAEYVQIMDAEQYAAHSKEHVEGAVDAIPNATQTMGGLLGAADKIKLDGIAAGANKYAHPSGDGNLHVPATGTSNDGKILRAGSTAGSIEWGSLSKSEIGLSNVPNVSTDNQTPTYTEASTLDSLKSGEILTTAFGKLAKAVTTLISHLANKSNPHAVTKAQVGLSNVDNTKDVDKPISTAVNTALGKKLDTSLKGSQGGVAELDETGKVPASQLPSYVDDVVEGYLSSGKFYKESSYVTEIPGESGKIFTDLATNKVYRWSGTSYTVISETLALGETSSTAYRGDRGKTAYDHSQSAHARTDASKTENSGTNGNIKINGAESVVYTHPSNHPASMITQDASNRFVSDAEKSTWNERTKKYTSNIGNGSASEIVVTHNLNTQDVSVLVRETSSPYNAVICDIQILSATQIKLLFATAPVNGQYRVTVVG